MLTNIDEFQVLLARYDDDPAICSKMLRTYALTEPAAFLTYAQEAVLAQPPTRAVKFIAGLAITSGLIDRMLVDYPGQRQRTIDLGHKLLVCDPRFDVTVLEFLQKPRPAYAGEESLFHAGLDLLDAISENDRLVPGVLKMLKHPNPKVRSKAALFVGSRTQNLSWAANRNDYDPRVRANIIESLYGINSDFVEKIFRDSVDDDNNRVAGNAVLGLYKLGDPSAIPMIYGMAKHAESRFRNTSAWLMGETGDPRFAHTFSELMNDPDPLVRAQAFKGLGQVRKALRAAVTRPELKAHIVKMSAEADSAMLIATVHDLSGEPTRGLPGTGFILKTGSPAKTVRQYTVDEYDCRSSLNVAFILCLPEHDATGAEARFVKAIQACSGLRRSKDKWGVVKLNAHATHRPQPISGTDPQAKLRQKFAILNVDYAGPAPAATQDAVRFEYASTQSRIDAMLREPAISVGDSPADEVNRQLLHSLLRVDIASADPTLVFFGANEATHLIADLAQKGSELEASVHVLAEAAAWKNEAVHSLVNASAGTFHGIANAEALHSTCFATYSSLVHHYRIRWPNEERGANIELDVFAEAGRASTVYEP